MSTLIFLNHQHWYKTETKDKDLGDVVEMASDTKDVKYRLLLEKVIEELRRFDDEVLFPYIKDLMNELEVILNSSPP